MKNKNDEKQIRAGDKANSKKTMKYLFATLGLVINDLNKKSKTSKAIFIENNKEGILLIRLKSDGKMVKDDSSLSQLEDIGISSIETLVGLTQNQLSQTKKEMTKISTNNVTEIYLYDEEDAEEGLGAASTKKVEIGPAMKATIAAIAQGREDAKAYREKEKLKQKESRHEQDDDDFGL